MKLFKHKNYQILVGCIPTYNRICILLTIISKKQMSKEHTENLGKNKKVIWNAADGGKINSYSWNNKKEDL